MARINNLTNFLTDVSAAIKEKTGDSTPIPAAQFDTKIASIETGGNYQEKEITITQNGNFNLLPDTGYDAMSKVTMNIDVEGEPMDPTTATVNDVINPKTFYSNGQKLTGAIMPTYENITNIISTETFSKSSTLYDFNKELGYAVANVNGVTIYKINQDNSLESVANVSSGWRGTVCDIKIAKEPFISTDSAELLNIYVASWEGGNWSAYEACFVIRFNTKTNTLWTTGTIAGTTYNGTLAWELLTDSTSWPAFGAANGSMWIAPIKGNRFIIGQKTAPTKNDGTLLHMYSYLFTCNSTSLSTKSLTTNISGNVKGYGFINSTGNIYASITNGGNISIYTFDDSYTTQTTLKSNLSINTAFPILLPDMYIWNGELYNKNNSVLHTYDTLPFRSASSYKYYITGYILEMETSTGNIYKYIFNPETFEMEEAGTLSDVGIKSVNFGNATIDAFPITHTNHLITWNSTLAKYNDIVSNPGEQEIVELTVNGISYKYLKYATLNDGADLLNGKVCYSTNGKIIGTMPNNGLLTFTPSRSNQTIPLGYTNGGTVQGINSTTVPTFVPSNIVAGVDILGMTGAAVNKTFLVELQYTKEVESDIVNITLKDKDGTTLTPTDDKYQMNTTPTQVIIQENGTEIYNSYVNIDSDGVLSIYIPHNVNIVRDNYSQSSINLTSDGDITTSVNSTSGSLTYPSKDGANVLYTNGSSWVRYNVSSMSEYTFEFEFYKNNSDSYSRVTAIFGPGYEIEIKGASNELYWSGTNYSSAGWKQNAWNKLKLVKSNGSNNVSLYINDKLIATKSFSASLTGFYFGRGNDNSNFFTGYYRNVSLKKTASNPTTITPTFNTSVIPENIKQGITIEGVTGTLNPNFVVSDNVKFGFSTFTTLPNNIDTSNVTDMQNMFYNCTKLTSTSQLDTSNATDMGQMFYNCNKLTSVSQLDTSNVESMYGMFYGCSMLTSIPQLDTSNVTDMSNMFYGCRRLTTVPILDTSSVTDMYDMFNGCTSLSDTSLDNILQMCINATEHEPGTLSYLGFNATNYPASRIQALTHYQDFINAGWTIGY